MLMIPNYQPSLSCKNEDGGYVCSGSWNSSGVFAVGNATDGALDECGFTGCSSGLVLGAQVRKAPSWPRSWANFSSPLSLHSHWDAWANLHVLGQPDTFLAAVGEQARVRAEPTARRQ
jgi:hypothetical protein